MIFERNLKKITCQLENTQFCNIEIAKKMQMISNHRQPNFFKSELTSDMTMLSITREMFSGNKYNQ